MKRRSSGDEVDCPGKKCFLVHHLRPVCVIPVPTNNSQCQIPCVTEGCVHETHREIVCPIWLCKPQTTTSSSTTTTTLTTKSTETTTTSSTTTKSTTKTTSALTTLTTTSALTTLTTLTTTPQQITTLAPQPLPVSCHSVVLYLSLTFNVLLLIALITLLFQYLKVKREDREFEAEIQRRLNPIVRVDRMRGQVGAFSLGSLEDLLQTENEHEPLLQSQRRNRQNISGASYQFQVRSNESSVSDDTFLRHRSEYMFMKTFKPSAPNECEHSTLTNESRV
jgi:hypothetical protein